MSADLKHDELLALASRVLDIESRAVDQLKSRLDGSFVAACDLCLATKGRVVVTGMGKSGHIGLLWPGKGHRWRKAFSPYGRTHLKTPQKPVRGHAEF